MLSMSLSSKYLAHELLHFCRWRRTCINSGRVHKILASDTRGIPETSHEGMRPAAVPRKHGRENVCFLTSTNWASAWWKAGENNPVATTCINSQNTCKSKSLNAFKNGFRSLSRHSAFWVPRAIASSSKALMTFIQESSVSKDSAWIVVPFPIITGRSS